MQPVFTFQPGHTPLLVSIPHSGTEVPLAINRRLATQALHLPDTDWFVDRLYRFVTNLGANLLIATHSRYVIDLNRPADDAAMYSRPGTGLIPLRTFSGKPIYQAGLEPDKRESRQRLKLYWQPYHEKLASVLQGIKQRFGYAVLLDAHSIRSEVPMLFEGRLPDLNLGSYRGASADSTLISAGMNALSGNTGYSSVLDGRFQGGYITRNYGQPSAGVHALQLEMAQSVYMREQPPIYDQTLANNVSSVLQRFISTLSRWSPA